MQCCSWPRALSHLHCVALAGCGCRGVCSKNFSVLECSVCDSCVQMHGIVILLRERACVILGCSWSPCTLSQTGTDCADLTVWVC